MSEVVRIGIASARIMRVTHERVEYVNEDGQELFIDLEQCADEWDRHMARVEQRSGVLPTESSAEREWRCVGDRDTSAKPPWARFMNERKTRFEFRTGAAFHELLHRPLMQNRWYMFDWT